MKHIRWNQFNNHNSFKIYLLRNTTLYHQWPPHSATEPPNKPTNRTTNRKTSTPPLVRRFLSSSKGTITTPMRSNTPPNALPKPNCIPIQGTQPPKLQHNAVATKHWPTQKSKTPQIRRDRRKVWCRISRIAFQNATVAAAVAVRVRVTVRVTMKTAARGRTEIEHVLVIIISGVGWWGSELSLGGSMCVIIEENQKTL